MALDPNAPPVPVPAGGPITLAQFLQSLRVHRKPRPGDPPGTRALTNGDFRDGPLNVWGKMLGIAYPKGRKTKEEWMAALKVLENAPAYTDHTPKPAIGAAAARPVRFPPIGVPRR